MLDDDFATLLKDLGSPHESVDMRGTVISSERLKDVLGALRDNMPRHCLFDQATFIGPADFNRVEFWAVSFRGCQFTGIARFDRVHFRGDAAFDRARFASHALFRDVTLSGRTSFDSAEFTHDLIFSMPSGAEPGGTWTAKDSLDMNNVRCEGPTSLSMWNVPLVMPGGFFSAAVEFEVSSSWAQLSNCSFDAPVTVNARASILDCTGVRFLQGGRVTSDAIVVLAEATFGRSLTLAPHRAGSSSLSSGDPGSLARAGPRLTSIQGADVQNLTLSNVDLRYCRLVGAQNIDRMHIDGLSAFARPPEGIRLGRHFPPLWFWTRRQILFEESLWRLASAAGRADAGRSADHDRPTRPRTRPAGASQVRTRWQIDSRTETFLRSWTGKSDRTPTAAELATVYRHLRKSREDAKDEPGAADFYYGEMEMRRKSTTSRWERWILTVYWLVSGYGLRGLRALVSLLLVIGVTAILLGVAGFNGDDPSYSRALIYAAQSTVSITSPDKQLVDSLSPTGQVLGIVLKLSGPLLLALTLLSVRNRVKR